MSQSPGLWEARVSSQPTGADDFMSVAEVVALDGGKLKAIAYVFEGEHQDENAALMAAAPVMLDALEAVAYWMSDAKIPCCFPRQAVLDALNKAKVAPTDCK